MRADETDLVEHLLRAMMRQRLGEESSALFEPVPEDFPDAERVQAQIDLSVQAGRAEVIAILRALDEWERD